MAERKSIVGPVLGGVAQSKSNDVAWVRAAFCGESVGFEPYVRVWVKEGKDALGLTVLMRSYPRDANPSLLPDVCVRWAEWSEPQAVKEFSAAANKRLYVRDGLLSPCILRFYHAGEIGIDRMMQRTSTILVDGVPFAKVDRPELVRRDVTFEFCDGDLFYKFSFFPGSYSNARLEQVVEEWLEAARILQSRPDVAPDDGFQIAYRESLWEQIDRYSES